MGSNDGNKSRYAIFSFIIIIIVIISLIKISFEVSFFLLLFFNIFYKYLDRLDGLYQRRNSSSNRSSSPIEKRLNNTTINIDDQSNDLSPNLQSKKKKVRWADIEENVLHLHKKAGRF